MAASSIEWTEKVWNPVAGCTVISPGCTNCYAMKMAARLEAMGVPAYAGLTQKTKAGAVWTGEVRFIESALLQPLRWRKPSLIFVNSMSDLFHADVPDEYIIRCFAVMALSPHHTYQVLTKRADRMRQLMTAPDIAEKVWGAVAALVDEWEEGKHPFSLRASNGDALIFALGAQGAAWGGESPWPLRNVWLGISAEDQSWLEQRAEDFARTPATVHFVSAEPLLGEVDFCNIHLGGRRRLDLLAGVITDHGIGTEFLAKADLVIVGGESGHKARGCWVPNVRAVVRQCADTGTAVFVKQLGANVQDRNDAGFDGCEPHEWPGIDPDDVEENLSGYVDGYQGAPVRLRLKSRKGGDPAEWPEDLRVRELPALQAQGAA